MKKQNKEKQKAIDLICSNIGISREEQDFYATYNPMVYYSRLIDLNIQQKEAKELIKGYQKFYDKVVDRVGRE